MATNDKKTAEIKKANWNRLVTYSFEVGKIEGGSIGRLSSGNSASILSATNTMDMLSAAQSGAVEDAAQKALKNTAVSLRIPPQSLNIQTQFASSVIATNKGILEENSGVVFRTISISGTTGIWPDRPQEEQPPGAGMKALSAFFPGALEGAKNSWNAMKKTASAAVKAYNQAASLFDAAPGSTENTEADEGNLDEKQLSKTGYYRFWELYNFFVEYAEFKKTPEGKDYCLIFNNPKDNLSFAITPLSFDLRRDSRNPLLYNYSISMKAWKVIDSLDAKGAYNQGLDIRSPSLIKQIAETMRRTRKTIQSFQGFLTGIQSDIGDVVNTVAMAHMVYKDAINLQATLFDMPSVVKNNAKAIWAYNSAQMTAAVQGRNAAYDRLTNKKALQQAGSNPTESVSSGGSTGGGASTAASPTTGGSTAGSPTTGGSVTGGESSDPTTPTGENANALIAIESAMKAIISDPSVADSFNLSELNLSSEVIDAINKSISQGQKMTAGDLLDLSEKLQGLSDSYATKIGLNNAGSSEAAANKEPTAEDIILLSDIQQLKESIISMTVMMDMFRSDKNPDTITGSNEILPDESKMENPSSFYPVTILRGDTIQDLAKRHLGSPLSWQRIADLNQLASPYIDETGFFVNIFNCKNKSFNIKKQDNTSLEGKPKLIIGQNIVISGTGTAPTRRKILNIQTIDNILTITVSGKETLGAYTNDKTPKVFARSPKTLGPGDVILIPSPLPPEQNEYPRTTPLIASLTHAEKVFLVDVGLGQNGDLKVGSSGDIAPVSGYANAIQAIRNIMEIEKGELQNHSDFGMPDLLGTMTTLISKQKIVEIIKQRLLLDPRFKNANVFIKVSGSTVNIRIEAEGASGTGLIPVEFQIDV